MSAHIEVGVIHSRATGVLFFAGFGSIWLYTGLSAMHQQGVVPAAAVAGVATALVLPALSLLRRTRGESREDEEARRVKRAFLRVNLAQWVGAALAVVLLNLFGRGEYVVPAIATIVGLHLFPLAKLYRNTLHTLTGSLLVAWSLACVLTLPAERVAGVGATGSAVVLLGSAAFTLVQARAVARGLAAC